MSQLSANIKLDYLWTHLEAMSFCANITRECYEITVHQISPLICYCPQRSCEGYVFTGVCLSMGGCLPQCMVGYTPPPGSRHPPRWPLLRTVRILLECILVQQMWTAKICQTRQRTNHIMRAFYIVPSWNG